MIDLFFIYIIIIICITGMSESLCSSIQEGKEAEMKKLKHDFKATPLPAFYRGQKVSKSRAEKVCVDVI